MVNITTNFHILEGQSICNTAHLMVILKTETLSSMRVPSWFQDIREIKNKI